MIKFLLQRAALLFLFLVAPVMTHAANFSDGNRWTSTATNGTLPGIGSPMTLTWSIMPDGLPLGTFSTDPETNPTPVSRLIARFDNLYNVPQVDRVADLTGRPWFAEMQTVFDIYSSKTGITYVYVTDDGAANGAPGVVGARGDVRIGGTDLSANHCGSGWAEIPTPAQHHAHRDVAGRCGKPHARQCPSGGAERPHRTGGEGVLQDRGIGPLTRPGIRAAVKYRGFPFALRQ